MKKLLLFAVNLLLFSNLSFSQIKLDYDNDSKWFWGFNYGATWQTTDVDYKINHGWGLTLGKSFNYNYGKVFSFDIRGRYLQGTWYGQNIDTSGFQSNYVGIYNQEGSNYKDSLGYTIFNFKSNVNRLALELVIHANRIRETSGWDPYIFGGIGLTWYETKGNLIDNSSFDLNPIYNYDSTGTYNVSSASALLDSDYETSLSSYKPAFMPSLGFGLGYQIGKRVSIGVEHKTTFTQRDNFDGVVAISKYKQDLYHYTSAYIRFQVKGGNGRHDQNTNHTTINNSNPVTNPTTPQPPIVTFLNPNSTETIVNTANYNIKAEIKYIDSRDQIEFKQENVINNNYSFNVQNKQLTSNVVLLPGQNTFEIKGTNKDGVDVKTTIIIYRKEAGNPPIVTITNPSASSATVSNPVYNFAANILNVTSKDQVKVIFNGQTFNGFTYNSVTNTINSVFNLVSGSNTVTVIGTNSFGQDSKTATIIYEKQNVILPPVVTFTNPSANPTTVSNPVYNLISTVLNVTTKNQISVKVNEIENTLFTFNPTTHSVNLSLNLIEGSNSIVIKGTNTAGQDSKSTTIIYRKEAVVLPPVVKFITPSTSPITVTTPSYNIEASVLNVTGSQSIEVKINGVLNTNFSYNSSSKIVSFATNLVEGSNTFEVKGTNTAGQDSKLTTIIYRKEAVVLPPVVKFISPSTSPITVTTPSYNIEASVLNVTGSQNIEVKINGVLNTNFSYNSTSKIVSFSTNLIQGSNTFEVKGTNTAGQDSKSTTIIYRKEAVVLPPVVKFITPSTSPITVTTPSYNIEASVLNVTGSQSIEVKINGVLNTNFSYNSSSKIVSFATNLVEGSNTFEVKGTNTAGQDSKSSTIIYRKEAVVLPPVVTISNPNVNPFTTIQATHSITASVLNVVNQQNIQVIINGSPFTNFTYNSSTKLVNFTVNLIEGSNSIVINASNSAGQASDNTSIIYKKPVVVSPPTVNITNPASNPLTVREQNYNVIALVTNINAKQNIQVKVNGIINTNFNFDVSTKQVSFQVILNEGKNTIYISASNEGGQANDNTDIYYKKITVPCQEPTVSPIFPRSNTYDSNAQMITVKGAVTNITAVNQIKLTCNGAPVNVNFDPNTLTFEAQVSLLTENNAVIVYVKNNCGSSDYKWDIKTSYYQNLNPLINVLSPTKFPYKATLGTTYVKGEIDNVSDKGQIQIKINGINAPNLNFSTIKNKMAFSFPVEVNDAVNEYTIEIIATNEHGKDTKTFLISKITKNGVRETTNPTIKPSGNTGVVSPTKPKETSPPNGRSGNK